MQDSLIRAGAHTARTATESSAPSAMLVRYDTDLLVYTVEAEVESDELDPLWCKEGHPGGKSEESLDLGLWHCQATGRLTSQLFWLRHRRAAEVRTWQVSVGGVQWQLCPG